MASTVTIITSTWTLILKAASTARKHVTNEPQQPTSAL